MFINTYGKLLPRALDRK